MALQVTDNKHEPFKAHRYGTWPERRAEAARRGWSESRCLGKHRYVYLLGTKVQRRRRPPMLWPSLPYPHWRGQLICDVQ